MADEEGSRVATDQENPADAECYQNHQVTPFVPNSFMPRKFWSVAIRHASVRLTVSLTDACHSLQTQSGEGWLIHTTFPTTGVVWAGLLGNMGVMVNFRCQLMHRGPKDVFNYFLVFLWECFQMRLTCEGVDWGKADGLLPCGWASSSPLTA